MVASKINARRGGGKHAEKYRYTPLHASASVSVRSTSARGLTDSNFGPLPPNWAISEIGERGVTVAHVLAGGSQPRM